MPTRETFYDVMRRHGITRRSFLKFCSLTAAGLGLGPEFAGKIAHALETKPRTPVIWLHGLECTCCTESFIRSGNPLAGAATMIAFGLGTVPLMTAAGFGGAWLGLAARKRLLKAAAWCVVLAGCVSIYRGWSFLTLDSAAAAANCPFCP